MIEPLTPFGDIHAALRAATPTERTALVLALIRQHPHGLLELPPDESGEGAVLDEIDLRGAAEASGSDQPPPSDGPSARIQSASLAGARLPKASFRLAKLQGLDLSGSDLRGARLGGAQLTGANLAQADLEGADLVGATLRQAILGRANLEGAMLEEVDLGDATLRFATLSGSVLEGANLQNADLWGGSLVGAMLAGADLQGARLDEADLRRADLSGAQLQRARLDKADLRGARLVGARLEGASLVGANLDAAVLRDAQLERLNLIGCSIQHVHLAGAWLERTRLDRQQLGGAVGEERLERFADAARGYLALERNFAGLGDADAASWSYRKRRRMQKLAAYQAARQALSERSWVAAASQYGRYLNDQLVEWVCDYGESIPRVLRAMLVVYVVFAFVYGLTGSVVRVVDGPTGADRAVTTDLMDLAIFSLLAVTTSGSPAIGLLPRSPAVHILTGIEALLGIFLAGLLGFVAGNRIRR